MSMSGKKKSIREVVNSGIEEISDREILDKYKPRFLGIGSRQVVFTIEGNEDLVVKVDKEALLYSVNVGDGVNTNDMVDGRVFSERKKNSQLREYFGSHVLPEHVLAMDVPITGEMLGASYGEFDEELSKTVRDLRTIVRVQRRLPVEALPINGGVEIVSKDFLSEVLDNPEMLSDVDAVLFDGAEEGEDGNYEYVLYNFLINKIEQDEGFSVMIRGFVENAIKYTIETGEILDLHGYLNAVAFFDDGWDFLLPDVGLFESEVFDRGLELFDEFVGGNDISDRDKYVLVVVLDYVRFVNALSIKSGSHARLGFSDRSVRDVSSRLLELRRSLL